VLAASIYLCCCVCISWLLFYLFLTFVFIWWHGIAQRKMDGWMDGWHGNGGMRGCFFILLVVGISRRLMSRVIISMGEEMWYGAGGEENEVRGGEWKEEYGGHIAAQVGGYGNVVL